MKIKWKCLVGAIIGAIVYVVGTAVLGYGTTDLLGLTADPNSPVYLLYFMVGLLAECVLGGITYVLYQKCVDKWY